MRTTSDVIESMDGNKNTVDPNPKINPPMIAPASRNTNLCLIAPVVLNPDEEYCGHTGGYARIIECMVQDVADA